MRRCIGRAALITLGAAVLLCSGQFIYLDRTVEASSGWKPVGPADLKVTAAEIGYPDADSAILLREGQLDDNQAEGTTLKMYVRIKIFSDRGRRYADVQLPYRLDLVRITDVHARTVTPDGKAIEVQSRDVFDKLLITNGRSVWRAKTFSMPAVEPGSIIEYHYRQVYPAGFRYFALDLQSDLFTRQLEYRIKPEAGSALDVRWVSFNSPNPNDYAPKWDGTFNIKARNIPPFRQEPLMPPELAVKIWGWLYYSKETETDPDKYWREYGQRMYERSILETKPTGVIHSIVDSITLPSDDDAGKIARIYNYVQKEVRLVGEIQAQADRLKRNSNADQTIRRRYGSASDINRLFISMLRAAGVDARVAEVTTRDENLFHRSFPDSFQFDAELTAVAESGGKFKFYDPASRYCPLGMLAWEKEGVPALVYDRDNPVFVDTGINPPDHNTENRVMSVTPLPDGRANVRVELQLSGHRGVDFRNTLGDYSPEGQSKSVIDDLHNVLPAADVSMPVKIQGLSDEADPVHISYEFMAPAFDPPTEKRLLIRPALLAHKDESLLPAATRVNPIYFHYPWSESDLATIDIPEAYSPEQLPDDVAIDIGAARFSAIYRRKGDSIVFERKLTVNGIIFDSSQSQTLKSFFDRVYQSDQAVISFKR
jgi:hypothetical protein